MAMLQASFGDLVLNKHLSSSSLPSECRQHSFGDLDCKYNIFIHLANMDDESAANLVSAEMMKVVFRLGFDVTFPLMKASFKA